MKNILAKLGSKKVMGAVLVMVTLVVGLGVISNFSGTDQKQANEAALSRFEDNAYNKNFYGNGVSRADLERQLSAQQDRNTARFLRGSSDGTDENDAYSADGAYAEGVKSDESFVYGDAGYQGGQGGVNGAYDPSNPMYAQGGVDENGFPYGAEGSEGAYADGLNGGFDENGVPYGAGYAGAQGAAGYSQGGENASSDEAAAEGESSAAAKARKAKQARERANRARRETQINKLANSGGSSSWGSFGGGAGTGGAGAMSMGGIGGDNASRALPSADAGLDNINAKAFKLGRGGAMGGYNVARGGGAAADNGKGGDRSAIQSALTAARFSQKGVASNVTEGAKSRADAAFDGSEADTGSTIDAGATIGAVNSALRDPGTNPTIPRGFDLGDFDDGITEKTEKITQLQKDLKNIYKELIFGALAFAVGIWALCQIARGAGPYAWIFWVAAALVCTAGIIYTLSKLGVFGNSWSLLEKIKAMQSDDLAPVNEKLGFTGMRTCAWMTFGVLQLVMGLAFTNIGGGGKVGTWLKSLGGKISTKLSALLKPAATKLETQNIVKDFVAFIKKLTFFR